MASRAVSSVALAVSTVILTLLPTRTAGGADRVDEAERASGADGAGGAGGLSRLHLPLVRRTREPFVDRWALPGGWVGAGEGLEDAARRTLEETTGLRPSYMEQLYTFGRPDRSPDGRAVSVVYSALVRSHEAAEAQAQHNVCWAPADGLEGLAFDHDEIARYALWRLRSKVEYAQLAVHFLGPTFSLAQLREVHEAVLQRPLDPANFRRHISATGAIVPTEERLTGGRHRPPLLYRAVVPRDAPGPFQTAGPPA